MLGSKVRRVSWGEGPQQVNATGRGAVEEQQPRTLQVGDVRDSLKQAVVLKHLLRQLVRDERTNSLIYASEGCFAALLGGVATQMQLGKRRCDA